MIYDFRLNPVITVIIIKKFYDAAEEEFAKGWVYYRNHHRYDKSDLLYFDTSDPLFRQFLPALPPERSCFLVAEVSSGCAEADFPENKLRKIVAYALKSTRYPKKLEVY